MTATWKAPGRVNLIGEHVDYQDGLVLPFAVSYATTATVSTRHDAMIHVDSTEYGRQEFAAGVIPGEVTGWAAYVAGVVWAMREAGHPVGGLDIAIDSDVPAGAGLSSSAALTCSVGSAIVDELGLGIDRVTIAAMARKAENDFAGAPTGQMDQLASMLSEEGHALLLDCRSLETTSLPFAPRTEGLELLLVDTHARHELVDGGYGARRADCEAAAAELGVETLRDAASADVDRLDDERLRRRAHHVVSEIQRVREVASLLAAGSLAPIGGLLTESHQSLRDDFDVSCTELDVTVEAALDSGALGARMVGGGFGGCAIVLVRDEDAPAVVSRIESAFAGQGWKPPTIHHPAPSQGARRVG